MSLHQLPEPCWILHATRSVNDRDLSMRSHYNTEQAARQAIAEILAEEANSVHDPADQFPGLTPVRYQAGCWPVRCDECGGLAGEDEGTTHFATPEDVYPLIGDWRTDRTGTPSLCPGCAAQVECATYGHVFDDYVPCACAGRNASHRGGCPSYRWCARCGIDDDPTYPATTPASVPVVEFRAAEAA